MDPITTAILAILQPLAGDALKAGVKDAYDGLKAVIRRKWGETAPITEAIAAVEKDPGSKAQAGVLEEKVTAAKADQDPEVARALQLLLEQMKLHGIGGEAAVNVQTKITGGTQTGIIGAGNVSAGTINFGKS